MAHAADSGTACGGGPQLTLIAGCRGGGATDSITSPLGQRLHSIDVLRQSCELTWHRWLLHLVHRLGPNSSDGAVLLGHHPQEDLLLGGAHRLPLLPSSLKNKALLGFLKERGPLRVHCQRPHKRVYVHLLLLSIPDVNHDCVEGVWVQSRQGRACHSAGRQDRTCTITRALGSAGAPDQLEPKWLRL
eukprot:UN2217